MSFLPGESDPASVSSILYLMLVVSWPLVGEQVFGALTNSLHTTINAGITAVVDNMSTKAKDQATFIDHNTRMTRSTPKQPGIFYFLKYLVGSLWVKKTGSIGTKRRVNRAFRSLPKCCKGHSPATHR